MCAECNNQEKGGQLDGLPSFNCLCHYLAVDGDDLVLVYEDLRPEYKQYSSKHVVWQSIVNHPTNEEMIQFANGELESWRNDARVKIGRHRNGFMGYNVHPPVGHAIQGIHATSVKRFNQKPGIYRWNGKEYVPEDVYRGLYYKHLFPEELSPDSKLRMLDTIQLER